MHVTTIQQQVVIGKYGSIYVFFYMSPFRCNFFALGILRYLAEKPLVHSIALYYSYLENITLKTTVGNSCDLTTELQRHKLPMSNPFSTYMKLPNSLLAYSSLDIFMYLSCIAYYAGATESLSGRDYLGRRNGRRQV